MYYVLSSKGDTSCASCARTLCLFFLPSSLPLSFVTCSLPPSLSPHLSPGSCRGIRCTTRKQPTDDTASTVSEESPLQSPRDVWGGRRGAGGRAEAAAPSAPPAIRTASSGIIGPEGQVMMRAPVKSNGGRSRERGWAEGGGQARGFEAARVPQLPLFKSRGEGKRAVLVDRQQEGSLELAI